MDYYVAVTTDNVSAKINPPLRKGEHCLNIKDDIHTANFSGSYFDSKIISSFES